MAALFKPALLVLVAVALFGGLAVGGVYVLGDQRLNRRVAVPDESVAVPMDLASAHRGQHLASAVALCVDCHGPNLAGRVVFDQRGLGRIVAPNLTRGRGGIGASDSDADMLRAIRHGVDRTGRQLLIMPSDNYTRLSDADVGAIIDYIRSVPSIDTSLPSTEILALGKIRFATGQLALLPSANIDHFAPRLAPPAPALTADYGSYLAEIAGCATCHGPGLSGLGGWSEADFLRLMRTGTRPDGRVLSTSMPWPYFAQMSEDELRAIWRYLDKLSR